MWYLVSIVKSGEDCYVSFRENGCVIIWFVGCYVNILEKSCVINCYVGCYVKFLKIVLLYGYSCRFLSC